MFGEHFYHKQIRNTVIAFGTIFNNINIKRLDSSGNPLQNIKVPLSYSPREKLNKNQKRGVVTTNADTTKLNTQYSPVPYDVSIQLSVFTSNSED